VSCDVMLECGNEPSSSIKCGEFLDWIFKKDSAPWRLAEAVCWMRAEFREKRRQSQLTDSFRWTWRCITFFISDVACVWKVTWEFLNILLGNCISCCVEYANLF
jgi:hypothetical protein